MRALQLGVKAVLPDRIPPVRVVPVLLSYKGEAFLNREHNCRFAQRNNFPLSRVYSRVLGVLNVLRYSLASRVSTSWISIENSFGQKVYIHISHILLMQLSLLYFFLTVKRDKWFEMTKWKENQMLKTKRREDRSSPDFLWPCLASLYIH